MIVRVYLKGKKAAIFPRMDNITNNGSPKTSKAEIYDCLSSPSMLSFQPLYKHKVNAFRVLLKTPQLLILFRNVTHCFYSLMHSTLKIKRFPQTDFFFKLMEILDFNGLTNKFANNTQQL